MVQPKKHLGQHFLKDENIAEKIALTLKQPSDYDTIIEIGPGMGVMTKYLQKHYNNHIKVVEIDLESVEYLQEHFNGLEIIGKDFLKLKSEELNQNQPFAVTGNYPYNISSQIVFKVIEMKEHVPEMSGMFQKEVAERICAGPGSKTYGIISVLTQAFYDTEYLFTVSEDVFNPPPKVKSGVMRMTRKKVFPDCNHKLLFQVVKTAFNQRRKMLRGTLKQFLPKEEMQTDFFAMRPEQLSVEQFIELTKAIENREA
jgi:16S rRNA (adenine1518-N6/adenine1519-N6)-dimethyltransferase